MTPLGQDDPDDLRQTEVDEDDLFQAFGIEPTTPPEVQAEPVQPVQPSGVAQKRDAIMAQVGQRKEQEEKLNAAMVARQRENRQNFDLAKKAFSGHADDRRAFDDLQKSDPATQVRMDRWLRSLAQSEDPEEQKIFESISKMTSKRDGLRRMDEEIENLERQRAVVPEDQAKNLQQRWEFLKEERQKLHDDLFKEKVSQLGTLKGTPKPMTNREIALDMSNRYFRTLGVLIPSALRGSAAIDKWMVDSGFGPSAIMRKWMDETILPEEWQQYNGRETKDLAAYWLGEEMEKTIHEWFPVDPRNDEAFWTSTMPEAMGSMTGFMLGGFMSKAPAAFPAVAGGLLGFDEGYQDAIRHGADEETARQSGFWNGILGTTEAIPISRMLTRFNKASGGTLSRVLADSGVEAFEESLQEFLQTEGGNLVARIYYDENRKWMPGDIDTEELWTHGEAPAAGGVSGFLFSLITSGAANARYRRGRARRKLGIDEVRRLRESLRAMGEESGATPEQIEQRLTDLHLRMEDVGKGTVLKLDEEVQEETAERLKEQREEAPQHISEKLREKARSWGMGDEEIQAEEERLEERSKKIRGVNLNEILMTWEETRETGTQTVVTKSRQDEVEEELGDLKLDKGQVADYATDEVTGTTLLDTLSDAEIDAAIAREQEQVELGNESDGLLLGIGFKTRISRTKKGAAPSFSMPQTQAVRIELDSLIEYRAAREGTAPQPVPAPTEATEPEPSEFLQQYGDVTIEEEARKGEEWREARKPLPQRVEPPVGANDEGTFLEFGGDEETARTYLDHPSLWDNKVKGKVKKKKLEPKLLSLVDPATGEKSWYLSFEKPTKVKEPDHAPQVPVDEGPVREGGDVEEVSEVEGGEDIRQPVEEPVISGEEVTAAPEEEVAETRKAKALASSDREVDAAEADGDPFRLANAAWRMRKRAEQHRDAARIERSDAIITKLLDEGYAIEDPEGQEFVTGDNEVDVVAWEEDKTGKLEKPTITKVMRPKLRGPDGRVVQTAQVVAAEPTAENAAKQEAKQGAEEAKLRAKLEGKEDAEPEIAEPTEEAEGEPGPTGITGPKDAGDLETQPAVVFTKGDAYLTVLKDEQRPYVGTMFVPEGDRRKGVATSLIMKAAEDAHSQNKPLGSGQLVSEEARELWKKLERDGIARRYETRAGGPHYEIVPGEESGVAEPEVNWIESLPDEVRVEVDKAIDRVTFLAMDWGSKSGAFVDPAKGIRNDNIEEVLTVYNRKITKEGQAPAIALESATEHLRRNISTSVEGERFIQNKLDDAHDIVNRAFERANEKHELKTGREETIQHVLKGEPVTYQDMLNLTSAQLRKLVSDLGIKLEGEFDQTKATLAILRHIDMMPSEGVELARTVYGKIKKKEKFDWRELSAMAKHAWDDVPIEAGVWSMVDAYNSVELGVNMYIRDTIKPDPETGLADAKKVAEKLREVIDLLPTQTQADDQRLKFQQYSTPWDYAFATAWIAKVNANDSVLEPSAGTGNIAVMAIDKADSTFVNEIDPKRKSLVKELNPSGTSGVDAIHANGLLPPHVKPTVVLMNPPFSQQGEKLGGKKDIMVGAKHVEEALKRLKPGGRLVAIVGGGINRKGDVEGAGGMGPNAKSKKIKEWWRGISAEYHVRANVGVDGKVYYKMGTSFDTRILVIDKPSDVTKEAPEIVTGQVESIPDLLELLEGVRNDRPAIPTEADEESQPAITPEPAGEGTPSTPGGQRPGVPGTTTSPGTGGATGQPGRPGTGGGGGGTTGVRRPTSGDEVTEGTTGEPGQPEPGGSGTGTTGGGTGVSGEGLPTGVGEGKGDTVRVQENKKKKKADGNAKMFADHVPSIEIEGAKPHPSPLVESAAMSMVDAPPVDYQLHIPPEVIESGQPSIAQLEAAARIGQAHNQFLEKGQITWTDPETQEKMGEGVEYRKGSFTGDDTGTGKGTTICTVFLDNINQGRKKHIWVSKSKGLIEAARNDMEEAHGDGNMIFGQHDYTLGDEITQDEGIMFTSYDLLKRKDKKTPPNIEQAIEELGLTLEKGTNAKGEEDYRIKTGDGHQHGSGGTIKKAWDSAVNSLILASNRTVGKHTKLGKRVKAYVEQSRAKDIDNWLDDDNFDGVIVFDEAHEMGNIIGDKPAAKARAGRDLQRRYPKARILYSSATGFTELTNVAYAERLGLWGGNTPFNDLTDFIGKIRKNGMAALEFVARETKMAGTYMRRRLSMGASSAWKGRVEHEQQIHNLTEEETADYDKMANGWQLISQNIHNALRRTNRDQVGGPNAESEIWGRQQRFFEHIGMTMAMPSMFEQMDKDLAAGESVIIQLTTTGNEQLKRELLRVKEAEGGLDGLNLTPKEDMLGFVRAYYPVIKYEMVVVDGQEEWVPVQHTEGPLAGQPMEDPEMVAERDAFLEELALIPVPPNPLDYLFQRYGTENVAENTGRQKRIIHHEDGTKTEEGWSKSKVAKDVEAFKNGDKRILVMSKTGGTGYSYHSSRTFKNQQRRNHYILQAGWQAAEAVQGTGRSHRTNQVHAPRYRLVTSDIPGQKRFTSSVARRLEQMGSLTSGQKDTASAGMFDASDNIETPVAQAALRDLILDALSPGGAGRDESGSPILTGENLEDEMGLRNIMDAQGEINETRMPQVKKFMNRMLMLTVDRQKMVFGEFFARLSYLTSEWEAMGRIDGGIQDFGAESVKQISEETVATTSGMETKLLELELQYRNNFTSFDDMHLPPSTFNKPIDFWALRKGSGRTYAFTVSETDHKVAKATANARVGQTVTRYRYFSPRYGDWKYILEPDLKAEIAAKKWAKVDHATAGEGWNNDIQQMGEFSTVKRHMLTGSILSIWDKLLDNSENLLSGVKARRAVTDQGDPILGMLIPPKRVTQVLGNLGHKAKAIEMSPEEVVTQVMEHGATVVLHNGIIIKRSRVTGAYRFELRGHPVDRRLISQLGGDIQAIGGQPRYFLNVDSTLTRRVGNLLKKSGIKSITDGEGEKGNLGGEFGAPIRMLESPRQKKKKKSKKSKAVKRIEVSPEPGGDPVKLDQLVINLGRLFKREVKRGQTKRSVLGNYKYPEGMITIKFAGDIDTSAHELGHFLDDQFAVMYPLFTTRIDSEGKKIKELTAEGEVMKTEMEAFWQYGSVKQRGHRAKIDYKLGEAFAEWIRAYLMNPAATRQQAPKFSAYIFDKLPENAHGLLDHASMQVRLWAGLSERNQILANIEMETPKSNIQNRQQEYYGDASTEWRPGRLSHLKSAMVDLFSPALDAYKHMLNLRDIKDVAPSKDFHVLLRLFSGFDRDFEEQLINGANDWTAAARGEGNRVKLDGAIAFDQLFAPLQDAGLEGAEFDRGLEDVVVYMAAQRIVERADVLDKRSFRLLVPKAKNEMDRLTHAIASWKHRIADLESIEEELTEEQGEELLELRGKVRKTTPIRDAYVNALHNAVVLMESENYTQRLVALVGGMPDGAIRSEGIKIIAANNQTKTRLAGWGGGVFSDLGIAESHLEEVINMGKERLAMVKEAARRYRKFADDMILLPMAASGRLSVEDLMRIKEDNEFYLNMQRKGSEYGLQSISAVSRRIGTSKEILKVFTGSTRMIKNPYVSLLSTAYAAQRESQRNHVLKVFRDSLMSSREMYEEFPIDMSSVGYKIDGYDEDLKPVSIWVNGKKEYWVFNKEIARAFRSFDEIADGGKVLRAIAFFPKLLRGAVTHSPPFMIRNVIRDSFQRAIVSRTGSKPQDVLGWMGKNINNRESARSLMHDFWASGGAQFGHYKSDPFSWYKMIQDEIADKRGDSHHIFLLPSVLFRKGWKRWTEIGAASERAGRMSEYQSALKKAKQMGYNETDAQLYAAYQARDVLDFAIAGYVMKFVNRFVPFSNAAVQGLRRSALSARENPASFMARWSMYVLIPELLLYAWNAFDDDEEYESLPAYQRDMFWNIKAGPNFWVRIPKPFELGVMATGVTRMIDVARGNEHALEGFGKSATRSAMPLQVQEVVGPFESLVEILSNYDFFRERPIIPYYEAELEVGLRKNTDRASNIGRFLQKMSQDTVDGRNVDHWIRSQLAGLGDMGLAISDIGREDKKVSTARAWNLGLGVFTESPAAGAKEVRRVLNLAKTTGQMGRKDVKRLISMIRQQRQTPSEAERDRIGKRIRSFARQIYPGVENSAKVKRQRAR